MAGRYGLQSLLNLSARGTFSKPSNVAIAHLQSQHLIDYGLFVAVEMKLWDDEFSKITIGEMANPPFALPGYNHPF